MAKKYKLSEGFFDKFWHLFASKKTPDQLQKVIDNDPVLKKLQKQAAQLNDTGEDYLKKIKVKEPDTYAMLKRLNLAP